MDRTIQPVFFPSQADFRHWLEENHGKASELYAGFYKTGSGKPSMTWSQSVDEAICYGWIDGVRQAIDKDRYFIRFTPRKPNSIWSGINIKKAEELLKQGLMKPPGIAAFNLRQENKSRIYSYEKEAMKLDDQFEDEFKANRKAWDFFQSMPPSYQKPAINWVMTAKQEVIRKKRLNELIRDSEAGRRIKRLNYKPFGAK